MSRCLYCGASLRTGEGCEACRKRFRDESPSIFESKWVLAVAIVVAVAGIVAALVILLRIYFGF